VARLNPDALAALALTTRLVDAVDGVDPLSGTEFWDLLAVCVNLDALVGLDVSAVDSVVGDVCSGERIVRLLDRGQKVALALQRLEQSGVMVVTALDDAYPARLRERLARSAPPALHVVGDPGLLAAGGLGVVGSRNVDEFGVEMAQEAAHLARRAGKPVVSGAARGVDAIAMYTALESGGQVVGFPADSMTRATNDASIRQAIIDGYVTLATPYEPSSGFTAGKAMGRNKLIYATADVTLVVACEQGKGGTWQGATEALRKGFGPVAVWTGERSAPGNHALVEAGALATRSIDEALLDAPFDPTPVDAVTAEPPAAAAAFEQMRFGD